MDKTNDPLKSKLTALMKKDLVRQKIYGGTIEALFDPQTHTYIIEGQIPNGVTSVLQAINKPALISWGVGQAIEYVKSRIVPGVSLDEIEIKNMLEDAKKNWRKQRDSAADVGKLVHTWCEQYIKGQSPETPVNPLMLSCVNAFLKWNETHKPKWMETERIVYSKLHKYAGMLDAIAVINDQQFIIDFKTGSGIYPEYSYQLAAYQKALNEEGLEIAGRICLNIPKTGKDAEEAYYLNDTLDDDFSAFYGALLITRRQRQNG